MLIEVEGDLVSSTSQRWFALLRGVVGQRVQGMVIDLRGCRAVEADCIEAVLAAAATMKVRGGSGASLVMLPGSDLGGRVRHQVGGDVRVDPSLDVAVVAIAERTMPVPFFVSLGSDGAVATVAVEGEFDHAGEDEFQEKVDRALGLDVPLIVDLAHCRFIDSTGIAQLLRAFQLAPHRAFALVGSGPQVHRVLELVGIPDMLPTFASREDARRALVS